MKCNIRSKWFVASLASLAVANAFAGEPATTAGEIVVTANRSATDSREQTRDVTVIGQQEIARAGGLNLPQLLARQPGVEYASNGGDGRASALYLRGTSSKQSVVLIDGVRVSSATSGQTALEQIPLELIDHIEIVRGPVSGLYGADAIGGVVQIFTKQGKGAPKPYLSAGVGNDGTWRVGGGIGGVVGDTSFSLNVAGRGTDGGFSATNAQNTYSYNPDDDGYRNLSYRANVSHQIVDGHEIGIKLFQSFGKADFDNGKPLADDYNKQRVQSNSVYLKDRFSDVWTSTLTVTNGVDRYETYSGVNLDRSGLYKTTQDTYTWQNDLDLGAIGRVVLGAEYLNQKVDSTQAYTRNERNNKAVFAGWSDNFGDHLLNASLRHDDNSQFGEKTTGSLGYGYRLTDSIKLTANYGTAFRVPTFNDLYWPLAYGFQGNPNLKPESARNGEVGAEYNGAYGMLRLTAFENRIDDMINGYVCSGSGPCTAENVDKARIRGLALAGSTTLLGTRIAANVNWQDGEDRSNGNQLSQRARVFGSVDVSRDIGPVTLGSALTAAGSRYSDPANKQPLAGYGLVDLYADYRLTPTTTLYARVNNVFDRDYTLIQGFNQPGREWLVGVNWQPK